MDYGPQGHKESDMNEATEHARTYYIYLYYKIYIAQGTLLNTL